MSKTINGYAAGTIIELKQSELPQASGIYDPNGAAIGDDGERQLSNLQAIELFAVTTLGAAGVSVDTSEYYLSEPSRKLNEKLREDRAKLLPPQRAAVPEDYYVRVRPTAIVARF